jgi:hypothetical protein
MKLDVSTCLSRLGIMLFSQTGKEPVSYCQDTLFTQMPVHRLPPRRQTGSHAGEPMETMMWLA